MSCHHIFIFVGQIPSYQTITCSLSRGFSLQGGTILFFHNKDIKYIYIVIVNNTIDMLKPFSEEFLASKRGFTFEIIADQIKTKYEILTQEGEYL